VKQKYTVQRGALDGVEAFLRVAEAHSPAAVKFNDLTISFPSGQ
jgi:hypothetical protein